MNPRRILSAYFVSLRILKAQCMLNTFSLFVSRLPRNHLKILRGFFSSNFKRLLVFETLNLLTQI